MVTSAELRWFWRGRCPQPVHDWFFKSGLPPGGGFSRVDKYVPQRGEPEISIKKRGDKPGFEVKGACSDPKQPGTCTARTACRNMVQVVLHNSRVQVDR